ncbi:hypothetical protein Syun_011228 [Stephania yunnanensis]|uniref:Uncharacterized protein n=1 Tax=Stephania yunnanensis TaxID=152371 RepID=A0AAP0JYE4_9MAGN
MTARLDSDNCRWRSFPSRCRSWLLTFSGQSDLHLHLYQIILSGTCLLSVTHKIAGHSSPAMAAPASP